MITGLQMGRLGVSVGRVTMRDVISTSPMTIGAWTGTTRARERQFAHAKMYRDRSGTDRNLQAERNWLGFTPRDPAHAE